MSKPISQKVIDKAVRQAAEAESVRRAMRARAARILPRAQRLAYDAGATQLGDALRVQEGTRPGSKARRGLQRPYARVVADITPEMAAADARAKLTRRQILTRASRA